MHNRVVPPTLAAYSPVSAGREQRRDRIRDIRDEARDIDAHGDPDRLGPDLRPRCLDRRADPLRRRLSAARGQPP